MHTSKPKPLGLIVRDILFRVSVNEGEGLEDDWHALPPLDEHDESLVSKRAWARGFKGVYEWLEKDEKFLRAPLKGAEVTFERSQKCWIQIFDVLARMRNAGTPQTPWVAEVLEAKGEMSFAEQFAALVLGVSRVCFVQSKDVDSVIREKALKVQIKTPTGVEVLDIAVDFVIPIPASERPFGIYAERYLANTLSVMTTIQAFHARQQAEAEAEAKRNQKPISVVAGELIDDLGMRLKFWWSTQGLGPVDTFSVNERGGIAITLRSFVSPNMTIRLRNPGDTRTRKEKFAEWLGTLSSHEFELGGGDPVEILDTAKNRQALHQLLARVIPECTVMELTTSRARATVGPKGVVPHVLDSIQIYVPSLADLALLPAAPQGCIL